MKISIIGGGYVGLVSAVCFADMGHFVTCIENNETKYTSLKSKEVPFFEPELSEKLSHVCNAERLKIAPAFTENDFNSDVIILAVGTPMSDSGEADLTYLFNAVKEIITTAKRADFKSIVLTTKSTVPVGTGRKIKEMIQEAQLSERF